MGWSCRSELTQSQVDSGTSDRNRWETSQEPGSGLSVLLPSFTLTLGEALPFSEPQFPPFRFHCGDTVPSDSLFLRMRRARRRLRWPV